MLTETSRVQPHPAVIFTELPNRELVLLNQQSGAYYTLNDTGLCIWEGLCQGQPVEAISQQLAASYDLTVEQAQPHVLALVSELLAEQLVTPV